MSVLGPWVGRVSGRLWRADVWLTEGCGSFPTIGPSPPRCSQDTRDWLTHGGPCSLLSHLGEQAELGGDSSGL